MEDITVSSNIVSISSKDTLNEILLQGAQQMLAQAIENEVIEYLERHADQRDENGRRLVVRNGYLPARDLQTGVGLVEVCQPRVNDKRRDEQGQRQRFGVCGMPWIVGIGIVGEEAVIRTRKETDSDVMRYWDQSCSSSLGRPRVAEAGSSSSVRWRS